MHQIFKKIIEVNYFSFIWYLITAAAIIIIDKISGGITTEIGVKTNYLLGFIGISSLLVAVQYLPNVKVVKTSCEMFTMILLLIAGGLVFFQQSSVHSLFSTLNQSGLALYLIWAIFIILYLLVTKIVIDE